MEVARSRLHSVAVAAIVTGIMAAGLVNPSLAQEATQPQATDAPILASGAANPSAEPSTQPAVADAEGIVRLSSQEKLGIVIDLATPRLVRSVFTPDPLPAGVDRSQRNSAA